eukprot:Lankesteria_metandrocarpae@DN400_c0_g1_i1.p1
MWGWIALQSAVGVGAACCLTSRRARYLLTKGNWVPLAAAYIAVVSFLVYYEIKLPTNLYSELGLSNSATPAIIGVRYGQLLKSAPAASNSAAEEKVKRIHKLLGHPSVRRAYNRYGDLLTESDVTDAETMIDRLVGAAAKSDEMGIFIVFKVISLSLATALFCWSIAALSTTLHPKFNFARQIVTFYLAAQFFLELHIRHMEDPVLLTTSSFSWLPYYGTLLPFEKVQFLRQLFPVVLSVAMVGSAVSFVDTQQINLFFATSILQTNRAILMKLEGGEKKAELASILGNRAAKTAAHGVEADATGD